MDTLFFLVLGTVVGSFLNVCIHRLPRGESIIFPASHCPRCQHRLTALELIPILSYLFMRGKCRYCGQPISWRYPLVELTTGGLFAAIGQRFSSPLDLIFCLIFGLLLVVAFFTDFEQQVIPDAVTFSGIILGLVFNLLRRTFVPALAGAALGFSLLFLVARLGKLIFKKEVMGEGDLFLAAALGAFLGWQGLLLSLLLAYLLAGLAALVLLLLGRVKLGTYVPFGPALAGAGIITLFFAQEIINWYLRLLL